MAELSEEEVARLEDMYFGYVTNSELWHYYQRPEYRLKLLTDAKALIEKLTGSPLPEIDLAQAKTDFDLIITHHRVRERKQ